MVRRIFFVWIDDEHRANGFSCAFIRVNHFIDFRDFEIGVSNNGELQIGILRVIYVGNPSQMFSDRIG